MCNCNDRSSMDLKTPRNVHLSAFYKRSFAYHTVKNRMPVIVTQVIDTLTRSKEEITKEYGKVAQEELKTVISDISRLKYELQTNKPLTNISSDLPDAKIYNDYIAKQATEEGDPTYFHTIWLLSECYMYRRLKESFENTTTLKDYDPFRKKKEESFNQSLKIMAPMGVHLLKLLEESQTSRKNDFITLLKLNLWGNKCDLAFTITENSETGDMMDVSILQPYILSDQSEGIWQAVSDSMDTPSNIVDIVLDNAGYEFFTDLCLADYLISTNLAQKVRMHVKSMPWFVSDVTPCDFHWTLGQLRESSNETLSQLGNRWSKYLDDGVFTIEESYFWTLPFDYSYMSTQDPDLYKKLGESRLVIFKGDLNYRKLFGEKNWDPATPVEEALQGFHPNKLATLRTLKADIVCGLAEGVAAKVEAVDTDWMISGKYGLIQYSGKIVDLN